MKKIGLLISTLLFAAVAIAQTTYRPPSLYVSSGLTVKRTAGTVNNGGAPVAIAADTTGVAMTDEKTDCSAPLYADCNIIYADSTGTVAVTTAIGTAAASGNTIIAYVSTHLVGVTSIVYGWQNGATFSNQSTVAPSGSSVAVEDCETAAACAKTLKTSPLIVFGDVALPTAAGVALTALPFSTGASFACTCSDLTNSAASCTAGTYTNGTTVTLTETGGANTDHLRYICVGF